METTSNGTADAWRQRVTSQWTSGQSIRAWCRENNYHEADVYGGYDGIYVAGHDEAGARHARLWPLIARADRRGVDPHRYLPSVLAKIGQRKLSEVEQLLPDVWRAEDAAPGH